MNLTPHFELSEFLRSQAAARSGETLDPPPFVVDNLRRLCVDVLEPLRTSLGQAVVITSGWRPKWLNTMIGGAQNSAHLTGRAADIHVQGMAAIDLARFIQRQRIPVDKCLNEFQQWVHVQVSEKPEMEPRREFLTARHVGGQTSYLEGLV